jgi:hypothetical protein
MVSQTNSSAESSEIIRERVLKAQNIQFKRQGKFNDKLTPDEIDNFLNKTFRPKFPLQVKKILKGKKLSYEELLKMKKFIEESTEYKALSDVGKEYQPYIRSINRNKFDYEGIESIDEMKVYEHQYKSLSGRLANGFFKGLNKIDNKLYSDRDVPKIFFSSDIEKGLPLLGIKFLIVLFSAPLTFS